MDAQVGRIFVQTEQDSQSGGLMFLRAGVDYQLVYPTSDVSNSNWLASTGTSLYAMVDEAVVDDSDFIYTESTGATFELALGDPVTPEAGTVALDLRLPFQTRGDLTIRLKQGTTQIAQWVIPSGSSGDVSLELTTGERDSISDWSNLRIWGST